MDTGPLLIALAIICFFLFFLRILMIGYRFYMLRQPKEETVGVSRVALEVHIEQARRQIEVGIVNNNLNTGSPGGNGSVSIETQNDLSILPKNMDLPPSYEELNYAAGDVKQQPSSLGASMLTINTNLECSNPNLTVDFDEPPPDYIEPAAAMTTTTTTTTVVVSGALPRI